MLRNVASKVMWVGRATVFLVGLAVILALVFGVAVTALAGTGVGATFNLGKTNTVNALSRLEGSTLNSMLKIDQNGSGTALSLEVQDPANKPPMLVNSSTKVTNLNADMVDGQSFTCPSGTLFHEGVCIESATRPQANQLDASFDCLDENKRLPSVAELQTFRNHISTFGGGEWSSERHVDTTYGASYTWGHIVHHSGGVNFGGVESSNAYRCVSPAL